MGQFIMLENAAEKGFSLFSGRQLDQWILRQVSSLHGCGAGFIAGTAIATVIVLPALMLLTRVVRFFFNAQPDLVDYLCGQLLREADVLEAAPKHTKRKKAAITV